MGEASDGKLARLQAVMAELLQKQLADSLADVEAALARWRRGELGTFEVHAQVLRHAARAERYAARMARLGTDNAASLLRDAFDAGLLDTAEFTELAGAEPDAVPPSPPLDDDTEEARPALPPKRQVVSELLGRGPVLLHADARRDGVAVPERHRDSPRLILRIGYRLAPPIPDLEVDDDGVRGTLTFGGQPFGVELPWASIYAVVSDEDHRGMVWPDDVPPEVLAEVRPGDPEPPGASPGPGPTPPRRGTHLKLVD